MSTRDNAPRKHSCFLILRIRYEGDGVGQAAKSMGSEADMADKLGSFRGRSGADHFDIGTVAIRAQDDIAYIAIKFKGFVNDHQEDAAKELGKEVLRENGARFVEVASYQWMVE